MYRVVIPDSHGMYADDKALCATVGLVRRTRPKEIVLLGDHVDCGGKFSKYARITLSDEYDEESDFAAAREFLFELRRAAPRARIHYLEGNHEHHVERWILSLLPKNEDASAYLAARGVQSRLGLDGLRIKYHRRYECISPMVVPGVLRLDGCLFLHSSTHAKHATYLLLAQYRESLVHGHVHRASHVRLRDARGKVIHGACPGTLSVLRQAYQHTDISDWTHGVGLQHVDRSGKLWHFNIPIEDGDYVLP